MTCEAGAAGTVRLSFDGSTVRVVDISLNPGWSVRSREESDASVEIHMVNGDQEVELHAEVVNGELRVTTGGNE